MKPTSAALPVDAVIPRVLAAVRARGVVVLVAPPGAGKTTRVPCALLPLLDPGDQVIVLQPRRVAARAAARYVARQLGSAVGEEVGYVVRFDRRVSPRTRIVFVTEGILTRRLQTDPFLDGVGAVVLDEFHERSLHGDLALALLRQVQEEARPDLRVIVMSATLDAGPVAAYLGDAPVVESAGRAHPVDVEYLEPGVDVRLPISVQRAATRLLREGGGDVLVFLPGAGEIARCREALAGVVASGVDVVPLHGDLPAEDQDRALLPGHRRRIILATNVAETSLTIEGVTAVIDSGLVRVLVHDPRWGLDRLELRSVSRASADQRAGRAGRLGPGRAVRLWTRERHRELSEAEVPEIRRVDLAPTVLELVAWGCEDPEHFPWFEAPSAAEIERAKVLLRRLGALPERGGGLTEIGRAILEIPAHPRLGRLLVEARRRGCLAEGSAIAALLSERDILLQARVFGGATTVLETGPSDVLLRLDRFRDAAASRFARERVSALGLEPRAVRRVSQVAEQLERIVRRLDAPKGGSRGQVAAAARDLQGDLSDPSDAILLGVLLSGFPDRVCRLRNPSGRDGVMVGGRGIELDQASVVRGAELFVAVDVEDRGTSSSRVRMASAIEEAWLEELFPGSVVEETSVSLDPLTERVVARRVRRYLDLPLDERAGPEPSPSEVEAVLVAAARTRPSRALVVTAALGEWLARVAFLADACPELGLPRLDEEALLEALLELAPGARSLKDLQRAPLLGLLESRLTHEQRRALDEHAPDSLPLPSGRRVRLRYEAGRPPVLSAQVQHLFGVHETPLVARGRIPVLVELLAPNRRPVQLTQDLPNFWRHTYAQVRKDLRGRYPKHAWPEVPPGVVS